MPEWKTRAWSRIYRQRINAGLERCRCCRKRQTDHVQLTFAHLTAKATIGTRCGQANLSNISILCAVCNQKQGTRTWSTLASLAEEERVAPPSRQWAYLASMESKYYNGDLINNIIDSHDDLVHFNLDLYDAL